MKFVVVILLLPLVSPLVLGDSRPPPFNKEDSKIISSILTNLMNFNEDEVDKTTENTTKIPTKETDSKIIVDEILKPDLKTNNSLPFTTPDSEVIEETSKRISEQEEEEDKENDDDGWPGMFTNWLSPKLVSSTVKMILIIFGVIAVWVCVYWSTEILCCTDFRKRKSQINQRV